MLITTPINIAPRTIAATPKSIAGFILLMETPAFSAVFLASLPALAAPEPRIKLKTNPTMNRPPEVRPKI